ncbi:MAG: fluoride efflux transporter CrcB [Saprospiraceae bacterium]
MNLGMIGSVAIGAAIGGTLRFMASVIIKSVPGKFPIATFIVNLAGSFILGLVIAYSLKHNMSTNLKLFWAAGICGGFTTFSTFSLDALQLFQNGNFSIASWYIALSLLGGLGMAWLGVKVI